MDLDILHPPQPLALVMTGRELLLVRLLLLQFLSIRMLVLPSEI
jgi:hypothetical protein